MLNSDLGVPLGQIWDKAPDNMKNEPWPHLDDYTKAVASWTCGARSPYAICAGTGFAIALGDEGLYVTGGGLGGGGCHGARLRFRFWCAEAAGGVAPGDGKTLWRVWREHGSHFGHRRRPRS